MTKHAPVKATPEKASPMKVPPERVVPSHGNFPGRARVQRALQQTSEGAIQRKCDECDAKEASEKPLGVQPKLKVGPVDDRFEQEADQTAERVMRMADPGAFKSQISPGNHQVQAKGAKGGAVPSKVANSIKGLRGGGSPLPKSSKAFFEPRFGQDFSKVRLHTDAKAAGMADSIQAKAFTLGNDIAFAKGAYNPESKSGKRLLAHELTHTVQQGGGRSPRLARKESDYFGFSEEEVAEFDYDQRKEGTGKDTGSAAQSAIGETAGTKVGKIGRISREQFLRKAPTPTKGDNIVTTLQFNDRIYVEKKGGQKNGWYKIVSNKGKIGWIPAAAAALDPPEPEAELYKVQPGDIAFTLVAKWYKPKGGFSRAWNPFSDDPGDARFYVSALAFANKGRAGMKSPDDLSERTAFKKVKVIAEKTIWKPSKSFLDKLKSKVSSGSITKAVWDTAVSVAAAVVDFVVGAGSFIGGLVYGALESIYDLFAGAVDLVKMIWDVLASLFSGNIVSDAKALWEGLKNLDVKALAQDFLNKWNAESIAKRWFFRGRVLGYIIMEIVMAVFSAGILTAIKWVGKFGKIGKLIAKFPKVVKLSKKVTEGLKKVQATGNLAKKKLLDKAAKAIRRSKPFTKLHQAQAWVRGVLVLSAETVKDLTLQGVNRLRTLSDDALDTLSRLSQRQKRVVLGCASACKVNLDEIKGSLAIMSGKVAKGAKKITSIDEVLAALPADLNKTLIKEKLTKHKALMEAITKSGLSDKDFLVIGEFTTLADAANAATAYRTFTRTLTMLVPARVGADINKFNKLADALVAMQVRMGSALKGSMFETFAKLHIHPFRKTSFTRATFSKKTHASLSKTRTSDAFLDNTGALWDFKHTVGKVPNAQVKDYLQIMNNQLKSTEGKLVNSVNYLFPNEKVAKLNAHLMKEGFGVYYVTPPNVRTKLK